MMHAISLCIYLPNYKGKDDTEGKKVDPSVLLLAQLLLSLRENVVTIKQGSYNKALKCL